MTSCFVGHKVGHFSHLIMEEQRFVFLMQPHLLYSGHFSWLDFRDVVVTIEEEGHCNEGNGPSHYVSTIRRVTECSACFVLFSISWIKIDINVTPKWIINNTALKVNERKQKRPSRPTWRLSPTPAEICHLARFCISFPCEGRGSWQPCYLCAAGLLRQKDERWAAGQRTQTYQ